MVDPAGTQAGVQVTFVPNPYYYDKSRVQFSKITGQVIASPSSRLQALETGQIEIAVGDASTASAATAAGLQVVRNSSAWEGFVLDVSGTTQPALAKTAVRQAMQYALDRKAITEAVYGSLATPTAEPYAPDANDPALTNYYPYDPAKAKQLLASAGYQNGFSLTLLTVNFPPYLTIAQGVAEYLGKVGINVTIDPEPLAGYTAKGQDNPPSVVMTAGPDLLAAQYALRYEPGGSYDRWGGKGWSDPALGALFASSQTDPTLASLQAVMKHIVTNAETLPVALASNGLVYAAKNLGCLPDTPVVNGNSLINGLDTVCVKNS
jgi:peptide/nickel transport system substrate-binding protein